MSRASIKGNKVSLLKVNKDFRLVMSVPLNSLDRHTGSSYSDFRLVSLLILFLLTGYQLNSAGYPFWT